MVSTDGFGNGTEHHSERLLHVRQLDERIHQNQSQQQRCQGSQPAMDCLKAGLNGPNNVGPTLCDQLETLGSTACFSNVFDNPIRFIPVETWCIKVFAKAAAQSTTVFSDYKALPISCSNCTVWLCQFMNGRHNYGWGFKISFWFTNIEVRFSFVHTLKKVRR